MKPETGWPSGAHGEACELSLGPREPGVEFSVTMSRCALVRCDAARSAAADARRPVRPLVGPCRGRV